MKHALVAGAAFHGETIKVDACGFYFSVEKICSLPVQERVTYSVAGHL